MSTLFLFLSQSKRFLIVDRRTCPLRRRRFERKLISDLKQNALAFKPYQLSPWSTAFRDGLLEAGFLPYNGYTLDHLDGTKIIASILDQNCNF